MEHVGSEFPFDSEALATTKATATVRIEDRGRVWFRSSGR